MTMPGGRSAPPFEQIARDVISATRPQPRRLPLTPQDRAKGQKVRKKDRVCRLCLGYHALSELSPPGCPRLASFELDGEGRVKAGTFWPGRGWKKGRVEFAEDVEELLEEDGDAGH